MSAAPGCIEVGEVAVGERVRFFLPLACCSIDDCSQLHFFMYVHGSMKTAEAGNVVVTNSFNAAPFPWLSVHDGKTIIFVSVVLRSVSVENFHPTSIANASKANIISEGCCSHLVHPAPRFSSYFHGKPRQMPIRRCVRRYQSWKAKCLCNSRSLWRPPTGTLASAAKKFHKYGGNISYSNPKSVGERTSHSGLDEQRVQCQKVVEQFQEWSPVFQDEASMLPCM